MKTGLIRLILITLILAINTSVKASAQVTVHLMNSTKCTLTYTVHESNGASYNTTLAPGADQVVALAASVVSCDITDGSNAYCLYSGDAARYITLCDVTCGSDIQNGDNGEVSIWVTDPDGY